MKIKKDPREILDLQDLLVKILQKIIPDKVNDGQALVRSFTSLYT